MNNSEKVLLDFSCESLNDPRVNVFWNTYPHYYFTDASSAEGAAAPGTIRTGSDGEVQGFTKLEFPLTFDGDASFSLQMMVKVDSLMTPCLHKAVRGFGIEIHNPERPFISVVFHSMTEPDENGKNASAVMMREERSDTGSTYARVAIPTDGEFHLWDLRFDGESEARFYIDGKLEAIFEGLCLETKVGQEGLLKIGNAMINVGSGTTDVTIKSIRLMSGITMKKPAVTGLTVLPNASSKKIAVRTTVNGIYENSELVVTVEPKDNPAAAVTKSVKPTDTVNTLTFEELPFGGLCTVHVAYTDALTRSTEIYIHRDIVKVSAGESITAGAENTAYVFDGMDLLPLPSADWSIKQFKKADGTLGTALCCPASAEASPFTVPVKLNGKFAVYVGYLPGVKKISVNGEEMFVTHKPQPTSTLEERFALADDFSGGEITLSNITGSAAHVAYVKFVSVSDKTYAKYTAEDDSRHLLMDNDGFSSFTGEGHDSLEFMADRIVNQYADGIGLGQFNFATCVTGTLNFPSKVRRFYIEKRLRELGIPEEKWPTDFMDIVDINGDRPDFSEAMRDRDVRFVKNFRKINETGIPHEMLANYVKEKGLGEFYVSQRMSAYYSRGSMGEYLNGTLYFLHPEWKRDGGNELSYIHEEYRNYVHDVLMEIAAPENVTGITMDFGRYYLLFGNELTDVKERTRIMTEFVRSVRRDLPDGKILNARVLNPTADKAEAWGLDYKTWVKEGLIDRLILSDQGHETFFDLGEYEDLINNQNGVEVYIGINASLTGHDPTKAEEALEKQGIKINRGKRVSYLQFMLRSYEAYMAGAKGIFLFNGVNVADYGGLHPSYRKMNNKTDAVKWFTFEYPAYLSGQTVEIAD